MIRTLLDLPTVDADTIGPAERDLVFWTWPGGKVIAAESYLRDQASRVHRDPPEVAAPRRAEVARAYTLLRSLWLVYLVQHPADRPFGSAAAERAALRQYLGWKLEEIGTEL